LFDGIVEREDVSRRRQYSRISTAVRKVYMAPS